MSGENRGQFRAQSYQVQNSEFEGFVCQVQHNGNEDATKEMGAVAVGTIINPQGDPCLVVNMLHPDGSGMVAVLTTVEYGAIMTLLDEAAATAGEIQRRAYEGGNA